MVVKWTSQKNVTVPPMLTLMLTLAKTAIERALTVTPFLCPRCRSFASFAGDPSSYRQTLHRDLSNLMVTFDRGVR